MAGKLKELTKPMLAGLDRLEATLMQPKAKAPQDVLAYPIMLNDKIAGLGSNVASADSKPTRNAYAVYDDLSAKIDRSVKEADELVEKNVAEFNAFIKHQELPAIILEKGAQKQAP
jgi:hypothetical protein